MRRLLITAGPTHEPIDPVRYIANRSSGKLGIALAEAGTAAGWDVTLLLGPSQLTMPIGVALHRFATTAQLAGLVDVHFPGCDVLIMAAAVADFRPTSPSNSKLSRAERGLTLQLEPTPDLVAACSASKRPGQVIVGFALEPRDQLLARATDKLRRKGLDAIVANPLETMGADTIEARLIRADGGSREPGPMPKSEFARWLLEQLGIGHA
jgi:phosphopantothenoylcysteine decarboxylase/phosphopantothenate--cysteine ligase